MLGDKLTVVAGSLYDNATDVSKIREDGYSSEYRLRQLTYDLKIAVAHTVEPNTGLERHVVRVRQEYFTPGELGNQIAPGFKDVDKRAVRECYVVIRNPAGTPSEEALKIFKALKGVLNDDTFERVVGWES